MTKKQLYAFSPNSDAMQENNFCENFCVVHSIIPMLFQRLHSFAHLLTLVHNMAAHLHVCTQVCSSIKEEVYGHDNVVKRTNW